MKKSLLLILCLLGLPSCDDGEGPNVNFSLKIMDEKVDLKSIKFIAYRNDTKKPLDLDSNGLEEIRKPVGKSYPYTFGVFGFPFEKSIKKAPTGYYEVEAKFRNGAYVRKKFGEIKGAESHLLYECLVSGDSTVEVHPK